jgi:hypothetical protein
MRRQPSAGPDARCLARWSSVRAPSTAAPGQQEGANQRAAHKRMRAAFAAEAHTRPRPSTSPSIPSWLRDHCQHIGLCDLGHISPPQGAGERRKRHVPSPSIFLLSQTSFSRRSGRRSLVAHTPTCDVCCIDARQKLALLWREDPAACSPHSAHATRAMPFPFAL